MKRLFALILALMTVACLFAACGGSANTETTTTEPEVTTTEPEETTTEAAGNVISIKKISKHEEGWLPSEKGDNPDAQGIYFNAFTNDAPYNEDWSLRYVATEESEIILVRDGKEYDLSAPGCDVLVKWSKTEYYLVLDKWLVGDELFPLVPGDMVIFGGSYQDSAGEWTIDIATHYVTLKEDTVKISLEDPRAAE